MDIDTEPPATVGKPILGDIFALKSNGLLSGAETTETDPAAMTAREELEMLTSNGLLDGSLDDGEVVRELGVATPSDDIGIAVSDTRAEERSVQKEVEASSTTEDTRLEFFANGLLSGGMDDLPETENTEPTINDHATTVTDRHPASQPTETGNRPSGNTGSLDEFQGNGLLSLLDDEQVPTEEDAVADVLRSARTTNTVANSATSVPPIDSNTQDGTTGGKSSLDKLLEEMDSAGYTTSEKGKGRARPVVPITAAKSLLRNVQATTRSTTPFIMPETESSTTPTEAGYPHMNLIPLTEEAEKLDPLEARDCKGRKVVFKRRPRKVVDGRAPRPESTTGTGKGLKLLETSYHDLLKEIEEEDSAKAAQALHKQYEEEGRALALVQVRDGKKQPKLCEAQQAKKEAAKTTMWVDKYRPTKFTDLLGEERSHRDVLGWLKEWDKCVFKRVNPLQNRKRPRETDELGGGGYTDVLGRPKERVILMSGPPGLGKTTLAHVVARQAGYDVFEINASDDRNAGTVSQRIKNALDAGSGLRSKGKPTCVVIDEIDGSAGGDAGFIRSLCQLIQDVPARKNSKRPAQILRRPIICICNDLYAPVLRPLRPFARIVRFKKPQPALIVNRLRQICDKERIKADIRGLTRLAEMTNGDVRSCLNTLQFMKSRSMAVTEKSLRQSSIGMKDSGASLHAVWHSLFVPVTTKGKRKQNGVAKDSYVNRLAFEVQSSGDQDRVVQGCFEHYPNLKPMDQSLANLCKVHDWMHFYDQLHHRVVSTQEWELMAYTSYAIVPWYSHLASPANVERPVEYPKADYEAYVKASTNKDVGAALLKSIPPNLRALYNTTSALTELVPMLMRIVSPNLKPVNANLVRAEDKILLKHLVELMLSLNLCFYRDKTEDGQPMFRLDPPIDVFIHYDGKRAADIAQSRFAVRQLVAQAMEAETIRRKGGGGAEDVEKNDVHSIFKQRDKTETVNLADKPPTDFFGRLVKSNDAKLSEAKGATTKEFRILYKFNEGSSSALRKTVKMSSMM